MKLNPTIDLKFSWTLRLANRPLQRYQIQLPRDLGLLQWLLQALGQGTSGDDEDVAVEISDETLAQAIERGLIVTPESDPGDVLPFACGFDSSLLDLVPMADREWAESLVRGGERLQLNPRRWLQRSSVLPPELAERLVTGASLRDRVGHPERGPIEGVPRGLGPPGPEGRLWVQHPETEILQPYELGPDVAEALDGLLSGAIAARELPGPLLSSLLLSHVLLPGLPKEDRSAEGRERLARDKYLVIPNAVSPLFVAGMRRHYRALERAGHLVTDATQVAQKRDGIYCEFVALHLQDQLGRWLNRVVPKPLKPSYTFFFRYHSEAALAPHRDRPQCLWNVSFAVDAEPEVGRDGAWPLCFSVHDETRSVKLGLGDAVLYSGTDLLHWRDALPPGHTAGVCFLHYVDAAFDGDLG
jgi:hypothetical protein